MIETTRHATLNQFAKHCKVLLKRNNAEDWIEMIDGAILEMKEIKEGKRKKYYNKWDNELTEINAADKDYYQTYLQSTYNFFFQFDGDCGYFFFNEGSDK